ncbi:methyltransferase type 11 [Nemania sp. FL0916]|nr:methyltransferase type 11 [Nemania sp. FL0916]
MDLSIHNQIGITSWANRPTREVAGYMLHCIKPNSHILDVGCGMGKMTLDFAEDVPEGTVTGVDISASAIDLARNTRDQRGVTNAQFFEGDILKLPFADDTFDVVHCHQVLGQLRYNALEPGPVHGLREMRRVCKPGGFVCAREVEWASTIVHPLTEPLNNYINMYKRLSVRDGRDLAGGRGREFARRAGFDPDFITASAGLVTYEHPIDRQWWGDMTASRLEGTDDLKRAVWAIIVPEEAAKNMAAGWRDWAKSDDGFYSAMNGQIVCQKEILRSTEE